MKNKDLEKTTAELERFTHIASHDLKSPLRTIISFLGLMERDMKRNNLDGLSENLAFAKSGANQLNYLIKDVLELSKINAKTYKERQEFDLSLTLKKVMFNIESELKEKNVRIHMGELPVYLCNEVEFVLLFQNFIQNGIKYNNSVQPKIKIWSEQKDDCICIYFKDNGIGIEEKYFSHIFEYFKRLHTTNEYSGSGLGLAMSKKIVESYQGEIELNSKIGEGSTFIIKLPLEKPKINSNSSLAQAN